MAWTLLFTAKSSFLTAHWTKLGDIWWCGVLGPIKYRCKKEWGGNAQWLLRCAIPAISLRENQHKGCQKCQAETLSKSGSRPCCMFCLETEGRASQRVSSDSPFCKHAFVDWCIAPQAARVPIKWQLPCLSCGTCQLLYLKCIKLTAALSLVRCMTGRQVSKGLERLGIVSHPLLSPEAQERAGPGPAPEELQRGPQNDWWPLCCPHITSSALCHSDCLCRGLQKQPVSFGAAKVTSVLCVVLPRHPHCIILIGAAKVTSVLCVVPPRHPHRIILIGFAKVISVLCVVPPRHPHRIILIVCAEGRKVTSGLCAVLITDKPTTSPLYKALSTLYAGKEQTGLRAANGALETWRELQASTVKCVCKNHNAGNCRLNHVQIAFSEVQASSKAVVERLGGHPDKLPSLKLVCNGDLQLLEQYQGRQMIYP
eukprot:1161526-Pelagomonas_calceolata.AAC.5